MKKNRILAGACALVLAASLKAGDSVQFIGFGTFEVRERAAAPTAA